MDNTDKDKGHERRGEERKRDTEKKKKQENLIHKQENYIFTKCSNSSLEAQLLITRHLVVTVATWRTGTRWGHNCTNNMEKSERNVNSSSSHLKILNLGLKNYF